MLEVANRLSSEGVVVRVNTDGLANLRCKRDVTLDLEGNVHALSISLNAQDEATYTRSG